MGREDNVLEVGKPRLCWFYDQNSETPDVAVMLEDTGAEIVTTVPLKGMGDRDDPYRELFDFSGKNDEAPQLPDTLVVQDTKGPVALVGNRTGAWARGVAAGHGRIVSNYAVLGGSHYDYERLNGVRSFLPALRLWTGMRSARIQESTDRDGFLQDVVVHLESAPEVPVSTNLDLTIKPTYRMSHPDSIGTFATHDMVEISTRSDEPATWSEHLDLHLAIRDLLTLSAWHELGFQRVLVNRDDDPLSALDGGAIEPAWHGLSTYRLPRHRMWNRPPRFLFMYDDIGVEGVQAWLRLRKEFARAIRPLVAIRSQDSSLTETRLMLSSVALECIAYQLADEREDCELKGGRVNSWDARRWVIKDSVYVPVEDPEAWVERSANIGNDVKHPDRDEPEFLDMFNTLRENVLVMRCWLAGRLGVDAETLARRAKSDPQSEPWVPL